MLYRWYTQVKKYNERCGKAFWRFLTSLRMSSEHHLSGMHRRIFRRVRLIATPKRGAEFVARVTGTSRSRKGPTVRFRDRRNCIFRDTISDITRVTPYWCRDEELEKRELPQVLLEEIKKKKKSVQNRYILV